MCYSNGSLGNFWLEGACWFPIYFIDILRDLLWFKFKRINTTWRIKNVVNIIGNTLRCNFLIKFWLYLCLIIVLQLHHWYRLPLSGCFPRCSVIYKRPKETLIFFSNNSLMGAPMYVFYCIVLRCMCDNFTYFAINIIIRCHILDFGSD